MMGISPPRRIDSSRSSQFLSSFCTICGNSIAQLGARALNAAERIAALNARRIKPAVLECTSSDKSWSLQIGAHSQAENGKKLQSGRERKSLPAEPRGWGLRSDSDGCAALTDGWVAALDLEAGDCLADGGGFGLVGVHSQG